MKGFPAVFESNAAAVDLLAGRAECSRGGTPAIASDLMIPWDDWPAKPAAWVKKVLDLALSLILLGLLWPFMAALALAVRMDGAGPIFYVSERIGRRGRQFACYKFRTMVVDADLLQHELRARNERDAILFKVAEDPRVTCVGRFLRKYSLDELPQLLNVVRGEMSLIGPRPPLLSEVANYEREHFIRLTVLPGMTGLWQVQCRNSPSFTDYINLDLAYIERWSLWLDFKILWRTIGVVLAGTGT